MLAFRSACSLGTFDHATDAKRSTGSIIPAPKIWHTAHDPVFVIKPLNPVQVKVVSPQETMFAVEAGKWVLVDVRPEESYEQVRDSEKRYSYRLLDGQLVGLGWGVGGHDCWGRDARRELHAGNWPGRYAYSQWDRRCAPTWMCAFRGTWGRGMSSEAEL